MIDRNYAQITNLAGTLMGAIKNNLKLAGKNANHEGPGVGSVLDGMNAKELSTVIATKLHEPVMADEREILRDALFAVPLDEDTILQSCNGDKVDEVKSQFRASVGQNRYAVKELIDAGKFALDKVSRVLAA